MRLLHVTTLSLSEFAEHDIPPYAILSHRWEQEEVSFQDMNGRDAENKAGFQKIKNFCRTAAEDGFEYVWVDTCCIDKTSSAELSEAINSMYRWYRDSEVCYVYLSDVNSGEDPTAPGSGFSKSAWFTRGWTLQELIAPSTVVFYDKEWIEIGTNFDLQGTIETVTGIPVPAFLYSRYTLRNFSIAQKMSWAANRKTSRSEDLAYCLLGLFDINMPMIYGEGNKAFLRLQEEIIKTSDDPTIFAWHHMVHSGWRRSLLATSPLCFAKSGNIIPLPGPLSTSFALTNKGVRIELPLLKIDKEPVRYLGLLGCYEEDSDRLWGIFLEEDGNTNCWYRETILHQTFKTMASSEASNIKRKEILVPQWTSQNFGIDFPRGSTQYRIKAPSIQDQYPRGLVRSDGMIGKLLAIGAILVDISGRKQAILLMLTDGELSARIAWRLGGLDLNLEDIVRSCEPNEEVWLKKPGSIVQEISPGCSWCLSLRKQVVSGKRTLTFDVSEARSRATKEMKNKPHGRSHLTPPHFGNIDLFFGNSQD